MAWPKLARSAVGLEIVREKVSISCSDHRRSSTGVNTKLKCSAMCGNCCGISCTNCDKRAVALEDMDEILDYINIDWNDDGIIYTGVEETWCDEMEHY